MELQAKVYIILTLIFVVMIIHMASARKKAYKKTQFPLMINAFRGDFSALNPLQIAYHFKHLQSEFSIHPILGNEIIEHLKDIDKKLKFNPKKSKSFYLLLKLKVEDEYLNDFIKEFSLKFDVVKIEKRTNLSYDLFIKERFTQFNLTRMTRFITDYIKKVDPMVLNPPSDEFDTSEPTVQ